MGRDIVVDESGQKHFPIIIALLHVAHQKNDIRLRRSISTLRVDDIYTCGVDDIRVFDSEGDKTPGIACVGNAGHEV